MKEAKESGYWVELTCPVCGKKFKKARKLASESSCCSHACARKLSSRRKMKFENPNGNFMFSRDDVLSAMDHPKEKILPCRCVKCGKEFMISYRQYHETIQEAKKGNRLSMFCSMKCALSDVDRNEANMKRKQTYIEKYGSAEAFYSYRDAKSRKTNLEKYGCENIAKDEEVSKKRILGKRKNYYGQFLKRLNEKHMELLTPKEEYFGNPSIVLRLKCLDCGTEFETEETSPQRIICPTCRRLPFSRKEKDLFDFVKSEYDGEVVPNARCVGIFSDHKEVDIWIPEKRLGIEFNGNYWHSDKFKEDPSAHQRKTLEAAEHGVRLIQVFEHEWDEKREKIKGLIRNAIGTNAVKLNGRDCETMKISAKEYEDFLDEHHLQGAMHSRWKYGLYHNSELVSVIGFGASRFRKEETELQRYCVKSGTIIRGGFGKLLKVFERDTGITDYVSYVDLTHFNGNGYISCGFKRIGTTKPNYVWINGAGKHYGRFETQKHKLKELLKEGFDPNETEEQNMKRNGFMKIYDCGNAVMRKSR